MMQSRKRGSSRFRRFYIYMIGEGNQPSFHEAQIGSEQQGVGKSL